MKGKGRQKRVWVKGTSGLSIMRTLEKKLGNCKK